MVRGQGAEEGLPLSHRGRGMLVDGPVEGEGRELNEESVPGVALVGA